ncbi:MAG: 16S rRNA (cytosine(967)-C(5))-methyltransferase [Gammaproteobacteria bacterium]|nr:MAG: 16S rRNA (cytosine(967)-C(5))-methyltransferase [Gammaproteobacteria bacterium]
MNTRLVSVYALYDVIVGRRSLSAVLAEQLATVSNPPDKGLVQEIVFGTLRHYPSLRLTLKPFLRKAIPEKNRPLEILLCSALYQLLVLKLPSYAVINESVEATKGIDFEWATGFVNGVLRAVVRDENLTLKRDKHCDHPAWLAKAICAAYPDHAEGIFEHNHHPARVMLRVRPQYGSRDDYLDKLQALAIQAEAHPDNKEAIVLTAPTAVAKLPDFAAGHISVQDANAQLAANLLGVKAGMRVLDACAAPGGKTAHLFDKAPDIELTAVDNVPSRIETLNATLQRLAVSANVVTADIQDTQQWHDGQSFERILLDAPCSATGVIRKHPDILFHRREDDVAAVVALQADILDSCWALLKAGGRLLYATCSILPDENQRQIEAFLDRTPDAALRPLGHNRAVNVNGCEGSLQFLPDANGDGFFYALLEKVSTS